MMALAVAAVLAADIPLFVASGGTKATGHPSKSLILLTFGRWEWFAAHQHEPHKRRGPEYAALKAHFQRIMTERLLQAHPELGGPAVGMRVSISTPLSYRHYMGTVRGEAYGLAMNAARLKCPGLVPKSPIAGFYLAGQDVCTPGLVGAMMGSLLCSYRVLGAARLAATLFNVELNLL